jgi:hypothetical protein
VCPISAQQHLTCLSAGEPRNLPCVPPGKPLFEPTPRRLIFSKSWFMAGDSTRDEPGGRK